MRDYYAMESSHIRMSMSVIPRRSVPEGHRIFRRWHWDLELHQHPSSSSMARVLDWNINML